MSEEQRLPSRVDLEQFVLWVAEGQADVIAWHRAVLLTRRLGREAELVERMKLHRPEGRV